MALRTLFEIRPVDYQQAMGQIIENHYLHRKAPFMYGFGLFDRETDEHVGTIVYGKPANHALCKGICGSEESPNVVELTRLWIKDGTPRNAESFLIGNTIKLIDKEILVSYAEPNQGHLGIVYQATNWIYTGLSDKHTRWLIDGIESHSRHIMDKYGNTANALEILGDRIQKVERSRKHRYVYFNCNRRRKRELMGKLRYKILPYPKWEGKC